MAAISDTANALAAARELTIVERVRGSMGIILIIVGALWSVDDAQGESLFALSSITRNGC